MLKILAACGSGMCSSQIIKMKIEKVFKEQGIETEINHSNLDVAQEIGSAYDVLFCPAALISNFVSVAKAGTIVVGLDNLLSEQEIRDKIKKDVLSQTRNVN